MRKDPLPVLRAQGAALVPAAAIAGHVLLLWSAPTGPERLAHWLPWPAEALFVWLPWAAVCLWAATTSPAPSRTQRASERIIATGALICSLHYVATFRLASSRGQWTPERHLTELAAFFSSTWHGAPWRAFAYALGWTACSSLLGRVATDVSAEWAPGSRALHRGSLALSVLVFLIGSSALLRYATGSPWPLLGDR